MARIVDLSQLSTDLASKHVSNFSWISPDQCNDMHGRGAPASDPCSFSNEQSLIAMVDAFLRDTVNQIMSSRVWRDNSAIVTTHSFPPSSGIGGLVALASPVTGPMSNR
jgi:phosphatidylinositol-3-phosphatase